jgi:hypothetical protein
MLEVGADDPLAPAGAGATARRVALVNADSDDEILL